MTSGQWDLSALEALERDSMDVFDVLDVPEHIRRSPHHHQHQHHHHHQHQHQHHLHQHQQQQQQQQHHTLLHRQQQQEHSQHQTHHSKNSTTHQKMLPTTDIMDLELQDHIKHCSCTCNHMGYGNFMDYQTSCFGGLPDVTEHSNHQHNIIAKEQSPESLDMSTHQKSSLPQSDTSTPNTPSTNYHLHHPHQHNNKQQQEHQQQHQQSTRKHLIQKKYCIFACSTIFILTITILIGSLIVHDLFMTNSGDRSSRDQRLRIVQKILHETPLIDGHNDLPWIIRRFAHNRLEYLNLSNDMETINLWDKSRWLQTDIPRLKTGLIGAQFWSAYVPCKAQGLDAVQLALEQIDLIQRFVNMYSNYMIFVKSSEDIIETHRNGMISSLIGVEGGHALGSSLGVLRTIYSLGVRYLTLTHNCDNTWAGGSESSERGLTAFGRVIISEMNRMGMMIDLSHSSDATAKDVLKVTRAPVIFSHSAARALCNSSHNIADDVLRGIAENGGIVMISFDSYYITCANVATIEDVIQHIKYIRNIAGIQHIGIGAGYDGIEWTPKGLEDVSKYPNIFVELLKDPEWTEEDISLLAGKNLLRVFKSVENVRDYWKRTNSTPMEVVELPKQSSRCTYMSL